MIETPTRKKHGKESTMIPQRRQLLLNFIHEYRRVRHGLNPAFVEMAKGVGYSSNAGGTAYHALVEPLIAEGWLKRLGTGARMIVPAKNADEIYCKITDPDLKAIAKQQRNLKILRRL